MTSKFWFGVSGSKNMFENDLIKTWWCLPYSAIEGDRLLLYCPRLESAARQGVFAEAKILVAANPNREENCFCKSFGRGAGLGYSEIEIIERFSHRLTAKHMKGDAILMHTTLVRRNFQGTTFNIEAEIYQRIKLCLSNLSRGS